MALRIVPSRSWIRVYQRNIIRAPYHTTSYICAGDHGHKKEGEKKDDHGHKKEVEKKEEKEKKDASKLSSDELFKQFEDVYRLRGPEDDHGTQRYERLYRLKMKRPDPRFQGEFSTLEEKHILYGPRGTIKEPVIVESVYPSRMVGCNGSEDTQLHDILWHVVKREKPCVCLECGQVFKLVLPEGEELQHKHHHH